MFDQIYLLSNTSAKKRTFARPFPQEVPCHAPKGIELSKWAWEQAKMAGFSVIHRSFEAIAPLLKNVFDPVVSWSVLEHVRASRKFLHIASGLLRPGGILALSNIDIDSSFPRLAAPRWLWLKEMHLCYFGSESPERMLVKSVFDVMSVESYNRYASLRYIARKLSSVISARLGSPRQGGVLGPIGHSGDAWRRQTLCRPYNRRTLQRCNANRLRNRIRKAVRSG